MQDFFDDVQSTDMGPQDFDLMTEKEFKELLSANLYPAGVYEGVLEDVEWREPGERAGGWLLTFNITNGTSDPNDDGTYRPYRKLIRCYANPDEGQQRQMKRDRELLAQLFNAAGVDIGGGVRIGETLEKVKGVPVVIAVTHREYNGRIFDNVSFRKKG